MICRLRDLIPAACIGTQIATGQYVRAMHEPFYGGIFDRARDALAVFRGEAVAVRWPTSGEFEQAMVLSEEPRSFSVRGHIHKITGP